MTEEGKPFQVGVPTVLKEGTDVVVFACGIMVGKALEAAKALEGQISVKVVNVSTIKPMNREEAILQMNLLGHTFFAFRDEEAGGAFAVVYKRNDGDYGIIEDTAE